MAQQVENRNRTSKPLAHDLTLRRIGVARILSGMHFLKNVDNVFFSRRPQKTV